MITAKPAVCLRASTLLAAALLLLHLRSPLLADAFVYQVYAFRAHEIGLFQDLGTLRTYGYPLFLYALTPLTGLDHLHLSLAAGVAQYLLFAGGTMGLWSCVPAHNTRLRTAILLGLLLNPWLIAHVTDALTEGLVLGLLVSAAALTVRAFVRQTVLGYTISVAGAALLMALSVVVRPASVVLCVAWLAAVLLALPLLPTAPVKRVQRALASLLVTSVACLLVWGPQVLYNQRVSGELAFPLVCRLGDLQLAWGLHLWKYETLQLPLGGVAPWYYPNPWLTNAPALSPALSWYLQHPVAGAATVLAHLFNSFSVNYLFTYVEDLRAWHTWPLRALYWVLTILGAHQAWLWTVQWRHRARERIGARAGAPPALVVALLVVLAVAATLALNSFTAVEVRFNLVPIAVVSVLGVHAALGVPAGHALQTNAARWLGALVVVAALALSWSMDRLGSSRLPSGGPAFSMANCALTINPAPDAWQTMVDANPAHLTRMRLAPLDAD
jgi:hypothetical protein